MTTRQHVQHKFPHSECQPHYVFSVMAKYKIYQIIRNPEETKAVVLGVGLTESKAWVDAKQAHALK